MKTLILIGVTLLLACYLTIAECRRIKLLPDHVSSQTNIAGYQEFRADRREFPHQVALLVEHAPGHTELLCSGAVIHSNFVLAAAHCFDEVSTLAKILVEAGEELDPQIRRVSRIIVHPEYTPFTHLNQWGVALVQLRVPLVLGGAVREAKLASEAPRGDATYSYWAGAGSTANHGRRELVYASVPLLAEAECQARLDWLDLPLTAVPLCSRPRGSALRQGSSGLSGAFKRDRDSGGLLSQEKNDFTFILGFNNEYGFYIRISWLYEWIKERVSSFHNEL